MSDRAEHAVGGVKEWSRRAGIAVDVHTAVAVARLPAAVESAVRRRPGDAHQCGAHSGATRASVVVKRRDGHVVAIDAAGSDGAASPGGNGGIA